MKVVEVYSCDSSVSFNLAGLGVGQERPAGGSSNPQTVGATAAEGLDKWKNKRKDLW